MSIGSNIKKRRFELRMSQQELADALGYKTRSTIAKIESGENSLTQKKLKLFADALDTSVEELISETQIKQYVSDTNKTFSTNTIPSQTNHRNVAVILAGGKSSRNQQNIPNQFINILGKPVIVYCLEAYQTHPAITDIYIVTLKGWEQIVEAYAEQYGITKLRGIIPGGSSGTLSIQNSLEVIGNTYQSEDIIIFQESTRPMISEEMISKLLQSCYQHSSACTYQSMKDYVQFSVTHTGSEYINRDFIYSIQSPEAYRLKALINAFELAQKKQLSFTESCCAMLLHNLGYKINFVEGNNYNIKIIRQEDIAIATALIRQLKAL